MSKRKRQVIETVAPKWGDEAAEWRWKLARIQIAGLPMAFLLLVILALRNEGPVTWILFAVYAFLAVPMSVLALVFVRRMNRAASKTLGVRVTWKADTGPPPKSPAYEQWCERNGLVPYGASRVITNARPR